MNKRPGGALTGLSDDLTKSVLLPIFSKWQDLGRKAFFGPVAFTVFYGVALAFLIDRPDLGSKIEIFNTVYTLALPPTLWLTSLYLYGLVFYLTYRLCGKRKSWSVMLLAAMVTAIVILTQLNQAFAFVFSSLLPGGGLPDDWHQLAIVPLVFKVFFAVGLKEEMMKAVPVFLALWLGNHLKPSLREKIGVVEPLDGIILAAASATMFALIETMLQYVPDYVNDIQQHVNSSVAMYNLHASVGLDLLLARGVDQLFVHIAYSGYFGYFIGLSVLKPARRWQILGVGYATAGLMHTLWDVSQSYEMAWQVLFGLVSYGFLAAAILKARELSPNRELLLPSFVGGNPPTTQAARAATPEALVEAAAMAQQRAAEPPRKTAPAVQSQLVLLVGEQKYGLSPGMRFKSSQIPGLASETGDEVVAEVNQHPQDPSVLGLKNLSDMVWTARDEGRSLREIPTGRSLALVRGTKIDFGSESGEVS